MANSPWGTIQYSRVIAPGCREVSTAGHGGLMLTERFAMKHLSQAARDRALIYEEGRYVETLRRYFTYEEDVDWVIPALELVQFGDKMFEHCAADSPYGTPEGRREALVKTLSQWNADYLIERGITPDPERYAEYLRWKERDRLAEQRSPHLIVSASGDWHPDCQPGECLVVTADGRQHFVTAQSYRARAERGGQNLLSHCVLSRRVEQEKEVVKWS